MTLFRMIQNNDMYKFLVVVIVLSLFKPVFGQESSIEGRVIDKEQMSGIPGITVLLKGQNKGTYTNANGYFRLNDLQFGQYIIQFKGIGFQTVEKEIFLSTQNSQKLVDQILVESPSQLGEVVISSESGSKEFPGSMYHISQKELQKFNYTDINRVLANAPGVNIQEEDGFGLRPNIGLRGTGVERSSKITLMEDGILIAPAPYVSPSAYYFPTIGRMSGIEIVKGSSQICFGPLTTGGAINLISTPIPDRLSINVLSSYGSFNTYQLHANTGNSFGRISYLIETFHYGSDGFKQLDNGGSTGFDKSDYLGKLRFRLTKKEDREHFIELKAGTTKELSNETYLGLTMGDFKREPYRRYFGSQKDQIKSDHNQFSISQKWKKRNLSFHNAIYRNTFSRNWYKLDKVSDTSGTYSIQDILSEEYKYDRAMELLKGSTSLSDEFLHVKANNRTYYSQGIQSEFAYSFRISSMTGKLASGIRIHEDAMDRYQWVDDYRMDNGNMRLYVEGSPGTESNRIERANAIASWAKLQLKLRKLSIVPGIRFEHIYLSKEDFGKNDLDRQGKNLKISTNTMNILIPGAGITYQLNSFTEIIGGVHRGFAPAGTNPESSAEISVNYEIGIRKQKKTFSAEFLLFYNDYENLLGTDNSSSGGTGTGDMYNGGKAESHGLETSISYDLMQTNEKSILAIPITLIYSYSSAHFLNSFSSEFEGWNDVTKGDELPYLANHRLSFSFGFEKKRYVLSSTIRAVSDMRGIPGQGSMPENEIIPAHLTVDFLMSYRLNNNFKILLSGINLTDAVYLVSLRPAGLRPGISRMMSVGFRFNY